MFLARHIPSKVFSNETCFRKTSKACSLEYEKLMTMRSSVFQVAQTSKKSLRAVQASEASNGL